MSTLVNKSITREYTIVIPEEELDLILEGLSILDEKIEEKSTDLYKNTKAYKLMQQLRNMK